MSAVVRRVHNAWRRTRREEFCLVLRDERDETADELPQNAK